MARPVKRRRICEMPRSCIFGPTDGQPGQGRVEMTLDEFETIRLIDYMGLQQEDCASRMNVARTTVQAIYTSARQKLAQALVCGQQLAIGGGHYELCPQAAQCCGHACPARPRCRGGCGAAGQPEDRGEKKCDEIIDLCQK